MSGALNYGVFPWPDDAIAFMRDQRRLGVSHTMIANQLSAQYQHPLSRNAVIGKCQRLGILGPSREAAQTAAKLTRALRSAPVRKHISAKERVLPDAVATRRVADLIRAEKREVAPAPHRPDSDEIAAAPCCLMQLKASSCRWPLNRKADDGQALFCANTALETGSYCSGHASRAYTRVISKDQREAERLTGDRHRAQARAAGMTDRVFGFGMTKRFA